MSGAAAFKRAGAIQLDPQTTQIKTNAFMRASSLH
jgi:hypothetical protein